jgi:hypothetical protein
MELKHVNLVDLLEVQATGVGLELIMEYCETDLKKVIYNREKVKFIKYEDAKVWSLHECVNVEHQEITNTISSRPPRGGG